MSTALAATIRIAVVAVALAVATALIDGIELTTASGSARVATLVVVAVIFGLVNAVLKPVIKVVGCPLYILTLGLVALFVNALLFLLVAWIAGVLGVPFEVTGFWPAFFGAIVVGIVSFVLHLIIPDRWDQR